MADNYKDTVNAILNWLANKGQPILKDGKGYYCEWEHIEHDYLLGNARSFRKTEIRQVRYESVAEAILDAMEDIKDEIPDHIRWG